MSAVTVSSSPKPPLGLYHAVRMLKSIHRKLRIQVGLASCSIRGSAQSTDVKLYPVPCIRDCVASRECPVRAKAYLQPEPRTLNKTHFITEYS